MERPIGRMEDVPGIEERPWDTTKPLDWTFENTYAPTRAMYQSLVKLRTNAAAPPPVSQQLISTSSRSVWRLRERFYSFERIKSRSMMCGCPTQISPKSHEPTK